jgi:hypothetical protein
MAFGLSGLAVLGVATTLAILWRKHSSTASMDEQSLLVADLRR